MAGVYVYKQALNVVARAVALQLNAYAVVHMCDVVAEVAESFGEASTHPSIDLVAVPCSGLQPQADTAIRPPDAAQRDTVQIGSPSQEELELVLSFCFVEDRHSDYQLDGLISWAHPQGKLNK